MNVSAPGFSPHYLRSRVGKVCVAIVGSTPADMVENAHATLHDSTFLEFRLDYLDKPLTALPKLKQFLHDHAEVTAIATCRRLANGGKFKGKVADEVEVLQKAIAAGFHLIDVELETAESLKQTAMEQLQNKGAGVILSYHDFETTKDLDSVFGRMKPFDTEFLKIVSTA